VEKTSAVDVEETVFTTNKVNDVISIELKVSFLDYNNSTSSSGYISCIYRKCVYIGGEKYCTEWKSCEPV